MSPTRPSARPAVDVRRSTLVGVLLGLGTVAFVDEAVFHQILHWHHFYDRSTPDWGLVSDGLFHAFSVACLVGGFFLFSDLRRRDAVSKLHQAAGYCLGVGGFQLYDGLIQHKWWGLHQIRYGVEIAPYDVAWNVVALAVLVLGVVLLVRARRRTAAPA
jgi:uncharacterized membrane protein